MAHSFGLVNEQLVVVSVVCMIYYLLDEMKGQLTVASVACMIHLLGWYQQLTVVSTACMIHFLLGWDG